MEWCVQVPLKAAGGWALTVPRPWKASKRAGAQHETHAARIRLFSASSRFRLTQPVSGAAIADSRTSDRCLAPRLVKSCAQVLCGK